MVSEWCYFKQHFSSEQCQDIIRRASLLPVSDASIGKGGEFAKDEETRRSIIRWIRRTSEWADLFTDVDTLVAKANSTHFQVAYQYCNAFQFTEYDESYQGHYTEHMDTFLAFPNVHRKLSVSVQLSDSDSYAGGDFEFTKCGQVPNPVNIRTQGTVIVFPSITYHKVNPVTSGKRYSLVAWYDGPQWR
jgi:PKHD-type hydroxylase